MKLALGTAQFGFPYGVANTRGQPNEAVVADILEEAREANVRVIDTACLYGESEAVIGRCLPVGHTFDIVTKTPKFRDVAAAEGVDRLHAAFESSYAKLGVERLYGLLIHDADDLLGAAGSALWQAMVDLRATGQVAKIGVSVYTSVQVDALLALYPLDLVQLPLSLLDQRLVRGGQLAALAKAGVEVHARSVFLQGALLLPSEQLPAYLEGLRPYLERIVAGASAQGLEPLAAALRYAAGLPEIAAVVCGVEDVDQFQQLASVLKSSTPALTLIETSICACDDPSLVDPSQWKS